MNLSTNYLGYTLKNPIIVGSSGLTNSVEKIVELEKHNAGAVVLKSLFEEQIMAHASNTADYYLYPEANDYLSEYSKSNSLDAHLSLIENARKRVNIPIIASINARTDGEWIDYAKKMEAAGAHAIELNISILPTDININGKKIEDLHMKILKKVNKKISIPISVKISSYMSGLASLIKEISWSKTADSIVMFNRFYNPDIDINEFKITSSNILSNENDMMPSLRWIAMLSQRFDTSFVASTGVFNGDDVIKQLLVGADAVQVVSAIYKKGVKHINTIISDIEKWASTKKYQSISDFKGKMCTDKLEQPNVFERIQFMKYYGNY